MTTASFTGIADDPNYDPRNLLRQMSTEDRNYWIRQFTGGSEGRSWLRQITDRTDYLLGPNCASKASTFAFENVVLIDDPVEIDKEAPPMTEFSATINLTKNLVGASTMVLPLTMSKASLIPGMLLLVGVGMLCSGSFYFVALLCKVLDCSTYRDMWAKSFGQKTSLMIDVGILLNAIFACLAYVILVCDFLEDCIPHLIGWRPLRWQLIAVDTIVLVLPLSYIENISPLRIPSMFALGIIACIFVWLVSDWLLHFNVSIVNFENGLMDLDFGIFYATSVFTGAFKSHYNAPTFYRELGEDLSAHARVVRKSFGAALLIDALFALAGFGIWGSSVQGNVLKNYSQESEGSVAVLAAILGMAVAVTLSYPLVFYSGRAAFYGLVPALEKAKENNPRRVHYALTTFMVACISCAACFIRNVQVVVGLTGATIGMSLCFIIPAMVHLKLVFSPSETALRSPKIGMVQGGSKSLIAFAILLLLFGSISVVLGSLVVLGIIG